MSSRATVAAPMAPRASLPAAPVLAAAALAGLCAAPPAAAHGFAGKRFFPSTLTNEDPFVADELSLPTVSRRKMPAEGDEPQTWETESSVELAKTITPNFGLGVEASHLDLRPQGGARRQGWDNLGVSAKYQFFESDEHEAIASVGLDWDIGRSGAKRVGAEDFSTFTPALFFGKGFGDLPGGLDYLRPLAVTGLVGVAIPNRASTTQAGEDGIEIERHPKVLRWGFSVEYSLPYLQSFVRDVGLSAPFDRVVPLVEFAYETPLAGGEATTGTVSPGLLWAGKSVQLGVEAVVPVNDRSGKKVGVIAQLHFFLDDVFPRSLGRPLWGAR